MPSRLWVMVLYDRTVLSVLALASVIPSGLNATPKTASVWRGRTGRLAVCRDHDRPQAGAVVGGRDEQAGVSSEVDQRLEGGEPACRRQHSGTYSSQMLRVETILSAGVDRV